MTFRLNAKQLFLTYPQCPLDLETVLQQLLGLLPVSKYTVAQEEHQNGELHIHAYLLLEKKVHIRQPHKLDLKGEDKTYHGKYEGCRSARAVDTYVKKGNKFLTNIETSTAMSNWGKALALARENKAKEASELLSLEHPRDMILHQTAIRNALRNARTPTLAAFLPIETYSTLPEWNKTKTLIISGPSGLGKTNLAKLLLPKACFCSHMDGLKAFDEMKHQGIIFDDMSFLHLPNESQIHLVDNYDERQIHCRHTVAVIPPGTPKVITHNLPPLSIINAIDPPIARRITCWGLKKGKQKIKVFEQ